MLPLLFNSLYELPFNHYIVIKIKIKTAGFNLLHAKKAHEINRFEIDPFLHEFLFYS